VDSAPAVGLGRIYVGSEDGNLYALNLQGALLWKFHTSSPISTTPAIGSDGTIYVAGCIGCAFFSPSRPSEGVLYAINPAGHLKWNLTVAPSGIEPDSLSSPTIGPDGTIYVSDVGDRIVAVHPNGTLKWQVWAGAEVVGSPALAPDGTVYEAIDDPNPSNVCSGCFEALNPDGSVKWVIGAGGGFNSPAVGSDGSVYVGDGGEFLAVNANGTVKWISEIGDFSSSSPTIGPDGTIYTSGYVGLYHATLAMVAFYPNGTLRWELPSVANPSSAIIGSNGIVYFASNSSIYAVSPSGALMWNFTTGPVGHAEFSTSDLLAMGSDATVYSGSHDGNLYAIG
jgi:outer membrane protein assembly factor BamB